MNLYYHSRRRPKLFVYLAVGLGLLFLWWIWPSYKESVNNAQTIYSLPQKITFAEIEVPLDDPKTYERIDTEFQILVYDQRGQINLWLKRLNKLEPSVKKIMEDQNLHPDFLYLAVKESSLLPCTTSFASARGLWQFIPDTATRFGLRIDDYVDERCDIFKATPAAAQYLKILLSANQFDGDVFSAMAAYNDGEGDVKNMLWTQRNVKKNHGYFSSFTNNETGRYVPGIIALKVILENPEQYGFEIPDDYPAWELESYTFSPSQNLNLADLAETSGLDFLDFKTYNPHLRVTYTQENFLPEDSIFTIYLPHENLEQLKKSLN